jgi:hypothetical protein
VDIVAGQRRADRGGVASNHHEDGIGATFAKDPYDSSEKCFA